MQIESFKAFVTRVRNATGRQFTEEQSGQLFKDLQSTGEIEFMKISSQYLEEEDPPRNIVRYFQHNIKQIELERERENEKKLTPFEQGRDVGGEVSSLQYKIFFDCLRMALNCARVLGMDYYKWVLWFNDMWEKNSGAELDKFLSGEANRLNDVLIHRAATPQ
jgi:hypothetical protein